MIVFFIVKQNYINMSINSKNTFFSVPVKNTFTDSERVHQLGSDDCIIFIIIKAESLNTDHKNIFQVFHRLELLLLTPRYLSQIQ